jgi:hypothetical protein
MIIILILSTLIVGVLLGKFAARRPEKGTRRQGGRLHVGGGLSRDIDRIMRAVSDWGKGKNDGWAPILDAHEAVVHGSSTAVHVDDAGTFVLSVGEHGSFGAGVYGSHSFDVASDYAGRTSGSVFYVLLGADRYFSRCDRNGRRTYLRTDGKAIVARVLRRARVNVRGEYKVTVIVARTETAVDQKVSAELRTLLRSRLAVAATVAAADVASSEARNAEADAIPPRRWWTRGLGLLLAAYFLLVWKRRGDYKSGWLGLFLAGRTLRRILGFGDVVKAPQELVNEAMDNLLIDTYVNADGRKGVGRQIRPNYERSQLFWMVGTMTIRQNRDNTWFGRDRYDFHRQEGQGVVAQNSGGELVWSFSTLEPTQERKLRFALRCLHIPESLYREREGRLELSNNFWNWLGGVPFQTEVRFDPNQIKIGSYDVPDMAKRRLAQAVLDAAGAYVRRLPGRVDAVEVLLATTFFLMAEHVCGRKGHRAQALRGVSCKDDEMWKGAVANALACIAKKAMYASGNTSAARFTLDAYGPRELETTLVLEIGGYVATTEESGVTPERKRQLIRMLLDSEGHAIDLGVMVTQYGDSFVSMTEGALEDMTAFAKSINA